MLWSPNSLEMHPIESLWHFLKGWSMIVISTLLTEKKLENAEKLLQN